MIAFLKGILINKSPESIIVDIHGVGYELIISLATFCALPDIGEHVELFVHTHVREDALNLYGFHCLKEKKLFTLLISVSKIGARLARNIISGMEIDDLISAIAAEEVSKLSSIPGIGDKTAKRLVLELKDKVKTIEYRDKSATTEEKATGQNKAVFEDVLSALVNLGYKKNSVEGIVKKSIKELNEDISLEELIRVCLGKLSS